MTPPSPPVSLAAASPQPEVTLDVGRLESRLRALFAMEPLLRMTLSLVWLFYWVLMPLALVAIPMTVLHYARHPEILWTWQSAPMDLSEMRLHAALESISLAIFTAVVLAHALLGLSRGWAVVAALLLGKGLFSIADKDSVLIGAWWAVDVNVGLHFLVAVILTGWVLWGFIRASWEVLRLSPADRAVLKPVRRVGVLSRRRLRGLTWIPPSIDLIASRQARLAVAFLLIVGGGFYLMLLYQMERGQRVFMQGVVRASFSCEATIKAEAARSCMLEILQRERLIAVLMLLVVVPLCLLIARHVLGWAQRRLVFSLRQMTEWDTRPPILFLRSFRDEQTRLPHPRTTWLGRIAELGRPRMQLEHLVLEKFSPHGPVITVGNPDDVVAPYGASREYLSHDAWHVRVESLWQRSRYVVLAIDRTEGVLWEVSQIVAAGLAPKCLFMLHPQFQELGANTAVLDHLRELPGMADLVPAHPDEAAGQAPVVGWFVDARGTLHVARAKRFTARTYDILLGWFHKSQRAADQPADPDTQPGHAQA